MTAAYGFKRGDAKDAMAILNIENQSQVSADQDYDTLAEYSFGNVSLQPLAPSFGYPSRWSLVCKTRLMGFNRPNGQSLYFDTDFDDDTDGYVSYPLSATEYSSMLKGGLYENPPKYLQKLNDSLNNKRFYRPTNVSLSTYHVPNERFKVISGDYDNVDANQHDYKTYLVGEDNSPYLNFSADSDVKSNFKDVLHEHVDNLSKDPIQDTWKVDLSKPVDLGAVQVPKMVDLNQYQDKTDDKNLSNNKSNAYIKDANKDLTNTVVTDDNYSSANKDSNSNQSVEVDSDSSAESVHSDQNNTMTFNSDDTSNNQVSSSVDVNDNDDADDYAAALQKLQKIQNTMNNQPNVKSNSHPYVDDFGQALQESNNNKLLKLRQREQLQNDNSNKSDHGIDLE